MGDITSLYLDMSTDTDSPSIDMDGPKSPITMNVSKSLLSPNNYCSFPGDLKQEKLDNHFMSNSLFQVDSFGDILTSNDSASSNQMHDLLMMDLAQTNAPNTSHINLTSPLMEFQNNLTGINLTPSMTALTNGLLDLSNPNTPHLPPLNIDAISQQSSNPKNVSPTMPPMPIVDVIGNNIPPPTDTLDWHAICTLNSLIAHPQSANETNSNHRKRKKINEQMLLSEIDTKNNLKPMPPSKRRKLMNKGTVTKIEQMDERSNSMRATKKR